MSKRDAGPAFPAGPEWKGGHIRDVRTGNRSGMTLRDWFAGQAMAGLVASPLFKREVPTAALASVCYEYADAMLEEREK